MFCLVYASAGVSNWSPEQVQDMLIGFREKNASLDVTGMLLYKDGSFLQALEGDEAVVRDLYATIAVDDRHQQVTLIIELPVETRSFSDWSMGLAILNPEDEDQANGVKRFDQALMNYRIELEFSSLYEISLAECNCSQHRWRRRPSSSGIIVNLVTSWICNPLQCFDRSLARFPDRVVFFLRTCRQKTHDEALLAKCPAATALSE